MSNIHEFLLVCLLGIIPVSSAFDAVGSMRYFLQSPFQGWKEYFETAQDSIKNIAEKGKVVNMISAPDLSVNRNCKVDRLIQTMEQTQIPFEYASEKMCRMFQLSRDSMNTELPYVDVTDELGTQILQACKQATAPAKCDASSKFRTIGGECNNLQYPKWGSARSCQRRLMPANYVGASGFRVSKDGGPLPEPRTLSLNIHFNLNRPNYIWSHMFVYFGQLLDHDITHTPQSTTIYNQGIECCPVDGENHPQCAPILIPKDDEFYSKYNMNCMNFVRSAVCPTCTFGPRQVMNSVTAFIDASFCYGTTENETRSLRTNDGTGRLKTYPTVYGDMLPLSADPKNDGCSVDNNEVCVKCGDPRCSQHKPLTSFQIVFVREHNRLAVDLRKINPHWDGNRIFEEARRIVGAEMQVITYTEYLAIVLGYGNLADYNLRTGYHTTVYDPDEDPSMLIEFSTGAFRFGHSLINSILAYQPLNASNQFRYLRDDYFQPSELYTKGVLDPIVAGACRSPTQDCDPWLVPDVTNYLYRMPGHAFGLDLAAININRGRDHGLPTYTEAINYCYGNTIKQFLDLETQNFMREEERIALQKNYRYVEDVDLWTGILSEIPVKGGVVGRTAACIIAIQFRKLRYADRFYFEHKNQTGSFSKAQVKELRKMTLSKLFCLNTNITALQKNAMLYPNEEYNPVIDCKYQDGIDLSLWKEKKKCTKY